MTKMHRIPVEDEDWAACHEFLRKHGHQYDPPLRTVGQVAELAINRGLSYLRNEALES